MISDEALQGIKDNCDFTRVGPLRASQTRVQEPTKDNDELCDDFINRWVKSSPAAAAAPGVCDPVPVPLAPPLRLAGPRMSSGPSTYTRSTPTSASRGNLVTRPRLSP